MAQHTVHARPRTVIGKQVKTLRRKGVLPANVYGHNRPSEALELDAHAFALLQRHLSAHAIVDLAIEGARTQPAMIQRTQRDVRTGRAMHVEFFQINPHEQLTVHVPLVLVGESEAAGRGNAVLIQEMTSLELHGLMADLPTAIEVRIAGLEQPGEAIHVRDLSFDRAKLTTRHHDDEIVVSLSAPQAPAEPEPSTQEEERTTGELAAAGEATLDQSVDTEPDAEGQI